MINLIFDLDDTLLMSHTYKSYNDIKPNKYLNFLLFTLKHKKFIYTNGTYGHGENSLKHMNLTSQFKDIYARDIIPYMKPDFRSFNHVRNSLLYIHDCDKNDKFIFFDDLINNLKGAKNIGWTTVWIHPEYNNMDKAYYIDYKFKNIIDALEYFKNNL